MTRLTLPIAAACAVFMAAALPATAQDNTPPQARQNHALLNEQKRPADSSTVLQLRIQATLDSLKAQEPENMAGKSPTTCFALLNNAQFSHRYGRNGYSTDLFSIVEIPAIGKGEKRKPVTDGPYTVFTDVDALLSLHKDSFHGGVKAEDLPQGALVGCATNAQDLRADQLTLNKLLLGNVVAALDIPEQRKPQLPRKTL